jgi:hypothetical protein
VCRRIAQYAIHEAELLGLVAVQERRLSYDRSDTNVITIISQEWRAWLRLSDKGGGCKTMPATPHKFFKDAAEGRMAAPFGAKWERQHRRSGDQGAFRNLAFCRESNMGATWR